MMKVVVDKRVYQIVNEFYKNALLNHPALDEETVMRKIRRLRKALDSLGRFASSLPLARVKTDWIARGYRGIYCGGFSFCLSNL